MGDEPQVGNPEGGEPDGGAISAVTTREITRLLADWSNGDQDALEKLTPLVYDELRRLAHHYMKRQRPDHTLQTTALVNEAYLRLANSGKPNYTDRAHFMAVAAKAMRHILVDHAKSSQRKKRGAGAAEVELDESAAFVPEPTRAILDLNDALDRLASLDARKAKVVEMKYFGGLNQDEIAEVLKVSAVTVRRDWIFSKAWLYSELHNASQSD